MQFSLVQQKYLCNNKNCLALTLMDQKRAKYHEKLMIGKRRTWIGNDPEAICFRCRKLNKYLYVVQSVINKVENKSVQIDSKQQFLMFILNQSLGFVRFRDVLSWHIVVHLSFLLSNKLFIPLIKTQVKCRIFQIFPWLKITTHIFLKHQNIAKLEEST